MKRLAELKGVDAVKSAGVVANAIGKILRNEKNQIVDTAEISIAQMLALYAQNNPDEMGKIIAVLSGRDEETDTNAAVVVSDLFQLATDPDLVFFFTLPYQAEARRKAQGEQEAKRSRSGGEQE